MLCRQRDQGLTVHRPTASAGSRLIKRGILNDSSVAMVQHLDSGDRRLFFQEDTGIIRHAIHSSSTNAWKADLIYTVASDAKNHTPITALGSVNSPDVDLALHRSFLKTNLEIRSLYSIYSRTTALPVNISACPNGYHARGSQILVLQLIHGTCKS